MVACHCIIILRSCEVEPVGVVHVRDVHYFLIYGSVGADIGLSHLHRWDVDWLAVTTSVHVLTERLHDPEAEVFAVQNIKRTRITVRYLHAL